MKKLISVLLVAIMASTLLFVTGCANNEEELETLRQEMEDLREQHAAQLQVREAELQEQVQQLQDNIGALLQEIEVMEEELEQREQQGQGGGDQTERALAAYAHYLQLIGHDGPGAWDADFTMYMDMDFMGMTISTVTEGHSAEINIDEENMELIMVATTNMGMLGSMDMSMHALIVDGIIEEMRLIVDGEDLSDEMMDQETFDAMTADFSNVPLFDLDGVIDVEVEEDGNYTAFHFLLDTTAMNDFIEEVMASQMGEMMDELGEDADMTMSFGDVMELSLVVYGSDDNPVRMSMSMEMSMGFEGADFEEMDGEEIFVFYIVEYRYNAFGDDVVIRGL